MPSLFFLVSGEHPSLPYSEVISILEAESISYRILDSLDQVLRINAPVKCLEFIGQRSAMTRVYGLEIFNCRAKKAEIIRYIKKVDLSPYLSYGETFEVCISRIKNSAPTIYTPNLERIIGRTVLENVRGSIVNLRFPQKIFFCILTESKFIFGLKMGEIKTKEFVNRGKEGKSFNQSSAMDPKLARCMINLAQPKRGSFVLDPFCGTGSFLIEAGLIGCRVMGIDVKRKMISGSRKNLLSFGIESEGVIVADAYKIPLSFHKADCIVTDPPYGVSTTMLGMSRKQVFENFFLSIGDFIKTNGRICIAAPNTVGVVEIGKILGFKHIESHYVRVHKSLTREIAVFTKQTKILHKNNTSGNDK